MVNTPFTNLKCPRCSKRLVFRDGKYWCSACKASIPMTRDKPVFLPAKSLEEFKTDLSTGFLNRLKTRFRENSKFYTFIFYILSPALFLGKSPRALYQWLPKDAFVIDIGSGSKRVSEAVVNLDIYPWDNVDVVADAHDLPFLDNSVDGVITTWTLEHLKYPEKVIREIYRVLTPGGYLYLSTNFVMPYHSSPADYYRWSSQGLEVLLEDFETLELRPKAGPTCTLLLVIQEWVSLALSFNIKLLKDFIWLIMVLLTFPFKILDLILMRFKRARDLSAGLYYIGRKPSN